MPVPRPICWLAALLVVLAPLQSWSQAEGRIPYVGDPPAIDGDASEWSEELGVSFKQENPAGIHSNLVTAIFVWDEAHLYVLGKVRDTRRVSLSQAADRLYLNDAVEVYLDPKCDSKDRMDVNDYQFIVDHSGLSSVLKGDKHLIQDSEVVAPKDYGIATLRYEAATSPWLEGADTVGYVVELAVPMEGLGILGRDGHRLKVDFCVDDVDSLVDLPNWPEETPLPLFFPSSWNGDTSFSFPDHWRELELVGGPSLVQQVSRDLVPYWLYIVVALVLVAGVVIGWQAWRIRQLKDVMPRQELSPEVQAGLAEGTLGGRLEVADSMVEDSTSPRVPQEGKGALHPKVQQVQAFVLARLDQEHKMEDLASECAMSLRSLQRLFREELDMSPLNFVVLLRMERAAELLRSGQFTVSEVGWQLGYQDSGYFSRVFKKYHGMNPREVLQAQSPA